MGCDIEKRNLQGMNFNNALLLPKNRRLLENLIKRKSIKTDDQSGQIRTIH